MPCQSPTPQHLFLLRLQLLLDLSSCLDALQNVLSVLVELQLRDDNFRWVNADLDGLAGGLVFGDSLDVNDVFETVNGCDLAFSALVGSSNDKHFIILPDGDGADLDFINKNLGVGTSQRHTLCFSRSSLLNGALMIVRRTLEGASKCALRDFLLEE